MSSPDSAIGSSELPASPEKAESTSVSSLSDYANMSSESKSDQNDSSYAGIDASIPASSQELKISIQEEIDESAKSRVTSSVSTTNKNETSSKSEEQHTNQIENGDSKNASNGFPNTVTILKGEFGCNVYVVGTAHFSHESQQDVIETIRKVKPEVIVLELCRARTAILTLDEESILRESESMDWNKMVNVIKSHGRVQGALYLLLLSVSTHITKQLGMAPGGEFRAAVSAAKEYLPHATIQLGDRLINVTLGRVLAALSIWQKMKLAFHILTTSEPISKEDVEKCKNKDMLEELLGEMTGQFPAISEVFVNERDRYLSYSIYNSCFTKLKPDGRLPKSVVAVVGIGHSFGIEKYWGKVTKNDISAINFIPPASASTRLTYSCCKIGAYCAVGFVCYRYILPASIKDSIAKSSSVALSSVLSLFKRNL